MKIPAILFGLVIVSSCAAGPGPEPPAPGPQQDAAASKPAPPIQARPEDTASIEAILAATYDVISGPAGKVRDWDRMRSLFVPDARLAAVGVRPGAAPKLRMMTVDDYVKRAG